jgi:chromosome segregation ATPase
MTDKNHEQYLEEIETAVAETTQALMESENYNLREAYQKIAQQDLEINRLKEYQDNDRKTIRNLRGVIKEATEEIDLYKEELDIAHHEYEKLKKETWNKTQVDEIVGNATDRIEQDCDAYNQENKRLEKELEKYKEYPQQGGWEKALENIKGIKDIVIKENHQLGEEIEKLKAFKSEVIDAMKYDDDLDDEDIISGIRGIEEDIVGECELKEQIEKLKEEIRRNDHDACSHLRQILELKEKLKSV